VAHDAEELVGVSAASAVLRRDVDRAAESDAKVLITGESGVGKEIVAGLIHARSARRRSPLVTINCAGVPDTLLESEFFGHTRGSFTGAYRDRTGLLEAAGDGTVFLDEIGEMSPRMQGLLLRFLETGEIQQVGGTGDNQVLEVRVIAATNRPLRELVEAGTFRDDLYYRLNVIQIHVPPLRDRLDDVAPLAMHFLDRFCRQYGVPTPGVRPGALERLATYRWPGNVRELRNTVERTVVRFAGGTITEFELPVMPRPRLQRPGQRGGAPSASVADVLFERMTRQGESFWDVVHEPFMARDLTRTQVRELIAHGLAQTSGSYKILAERFGIRPGDYKRFLGLLRKHECHIPFQPFRNSTIKIEDVSPGLAPR
jgi:transcriptional regulator with PAS, ATPase and Fis domain